MKEPGKTKRSSKKPKPFNIAIQDIKESEFFCKETSVDIQSQILKNGIRIGFGVKFNPNENEKTITVGFRVRYDCTLREQECNVMRFEFHTTFLLSEFEQVYLEGSEDQRKIDPGFLISLLGIVAGTARGMLAIRTSGTFIEKVYLPIINPTELFKSIFSKRREKEDKPDTSKD